MREEQLNHQFEEATKRGQDALAASPKAKAITYNAKSKRIVIEFESGVSAVIPTNLIEILQYATPEQVGDVELAVEGLYLRWKSLDEDLFVPNLLQGIFGTRKWMDELKKHLSEAGKKGGASRSEAKRKSSAENGKKGGRPRTEQVA